MSRYEPIAFESLEPRVLLSVAFRLDYGYDANGFFDEPARREVMEAAADYVGSLLNDSLTAIIPSGGNSWRIQFNDPATGAAAEVNNPVINEDELLLFVGGRDLGGDTLGLGGAGGWQASGSSAFLLNIEGRGQSGATGPDAGQTDTSLWGGSIVFDIDANWHFGITTEGLAGNENDFYSVAVHEIFHVLGFTDGNPAFANLISPSGVFMGPAAMAVSVDTELMATDYAHWREGLSSAGQETLMDPTFTRGTRKLITPLDFAAMEDIGWELDAIRYPGRGSQLPLSLAGTGIASGTATSAVPGLHWVDVREAGLLDFRVQSVNPLSLRLWDSRGMLVEQVDNTQLGFASLNIVATDQFYTIELFGQSDSDYDLAVTNADLDEVAYYPEGFASNEIDQFVMVSNPTDEVQLFTLSLRYERDDLGRDSDSVAFEQEVRPRQTVRVDIARNRSFAQDVQTGRAILLDQPYALVLYSTAPLGAALEHADEFGGQRITTAEDFTRQTDDTWYFPRVAKVSQVNDFLTFYNPNEHDALITIRFRAISAEFRLTQVVRAQARGGLDVQSIGGLALGEFQAIVTSQALDSADQPMHQGIVAALTHFNGQQGDGWTVLGAAADTLPTSGVVPLANIAGGGTQALIFNPGSTVARLQLIRDTASGSEMLAERFVPALGGSSLTLPEGVGYRYEFTSGLGVVQFVQTFAGEATSSQGSTPASRTLAFTLGSFDPADTDSLLRLSFYNTGLVGTSVTVRFLFSNGAEVVQSVTVASRAIASLNIESIQAVRDRVADGPLGVLLESATPLTGLLARLEGETGWASGGMLLPA